MKCVRFQRIFWGFTLEYLTVVLDKTCTTRVLIISSQTFDLFWTSFILDSENGLRKTIWPICDLDDPTIGKPIALFGGQNFTGSVNDCISLTQNFSEAFESRLFVL